MVTETYGLRKDYHLQLIYLLVLACIVRVFT